MHESLGGFRILPYLCNRKRKNDAEQKLGEIILQALNYDTSARFSQSLLCFREKIENVKTTSQETLLFKGDTIELPNELENIEDDISSDHEFANTLIGEIDKNWVTVENALSRDDDGDADASGNNFSVAFASTCIPNPDILVSDGNGELTAETPYAGMFVKDADPEVLKNLDAREQLFDAPKFEHEYPHCWRCDKPLIYYARESWYIKETA